MTGPSDSDENGSSKRNNSSQSEDTSYSKTDAFMTLLIESLNVASSAVPVLGAGFGALSSVLTLNRTSDTAISRLETFLKSINDALPTGYQTQLNTNSFAQSVEQDNSKSIDSDPKPSSSNEVLPTPTPAKTPSFHPMKSEQPDLYNQLRLCAKSFQIAFEAADNFLKSFQATKVISRGKKIWKKTVHSNAIPSICDAHIVTIQQSLDTFRFRYIISKFKDSEDKIVSQLQKMNDLKIKAFEDIFKENASMNRQILGLTQKNSSLIQKNSSLIQKNSSLTQQILDQRNTFSESFNGFITILNEFCKLQPTEKISTFIKSFNLFNCQHLIVRVGKIVLPSFSSSRSFILVSLSLVENQTPNESMEFPIRLLLENIPKEANILFLYSNFHEIFKKIFGIFPQNQIQNIKSLSDTDLQNRKFFLKIEPNKNSLEISSQNRFRFLVEDQTGVVKLTDKPTPNSSSNFQTEEQVPFPFISWPNLTQRQGYYCKYHSTTAFYFQPTILACHIQKIVINQDLKIVQSISDFYPESNNLVYYKNLTQEQDVDFIKGSIFLFGSKMEYKLNLRKTEFTNPIQSVFCKQLFIFIFSFLFDGPIPDEEESSTELTNNDEVLSTEPTNNDVLSTECSTHEEEIHSETEFEALILCQDQIHTTSSSTFGIEIGKRITYVYQNKRDYNDEMIKNIKDELQKQQIYFLVSSEDKNLLSNINYTFIPIEQNLCLFRNLFYFPNRTIFFDSLESIKSKIPIFKPILVFLQQYQKKFLILVQLPDNGLNQSIKNNLSEIRQDLPSYKCDNNFTTSSQYCFFFKQNSTFDQNFVFNQARLVKWIEN